MRVKSNWMFRISHRIFSTELNPDIGDDYGYIVLSPLFESQFDELAASPL